MPPGRRPARSVPAGRSGATAEPYCIVIPPPNVTGSLHMGHALNNTLQDILVPLRAHARQGRALAARHRPRRHRHPDGGRAPADGAPGAGPARARPREVPREGLGLEGGVGRHHHQPAQAARRLLRLVARALHHGRGALARGAQGVRRALPRGADLQGQAAGQLGPEAAHRHLRPRSAAGRDQGPALALPLSGRRRSPTTFITVATTRPETMLGDTAVAVHPDDERYRHLVGKHAILPLVGRRIPIVADEYSDPEKGTGAVKITPAHDFNDFEVGRRHDLPLVNVLDLEANLDLENNEAFLDGLTRWRRSWTRRCRCTASTASSRASRSSSAWRQLGLRRQDRAARPHGAARRPLRRGDRAVPDRPVVRRRQDAGAAGDRGGARRRAPRSCRSNGKRPISTGWRTSSPGASRASSGGATRFRPGTAGVDGEQSVDRRRREVFVAETEAEALQRAENYYKTATSCWSAAWTRASTRSALARRDAATRFRSGATRTCSTPGSPRRCGRSRRSAGPTRPPELKRYYPTNVLVTGFDIIFFWVARMMMMGLHFMKEVPFHTVYIHALVRDERGAKMSKSKGNVIDPLELIDEYGADALRFTLAAMAAQGRDIKLSTQRVEGYRNFATKLWNAAPLRRDERLRARSPGFDPASIKETLNRWIAHETAEGRARDHRGDRGLPVQRGGRRGLSLRLEHLCDWYLELAKPVLHGADGPAKDETRAMAAWVRDEILKLLHPFMPFITEELWRVDRASSGPERDGPAGAGALAEARRARRPRGRGRDRLGDRSRHRHPLGARRDEHHGRDRAPAGAGRRLGRDRRAGRALGRVHPAAGAALQPFGRRRRVPPGSVQLMVRGEVAALPLKGVIDFAAEEARLEKEMARVDCRHRAHRRQARQCRLRAPRAGGGGRGRAREARGGAKAAAPRSSRRWSGSRARRSRFGHVREAQARAAHPAVGRMAGRRCSPLRSSSR